MNDVKVSVLVPICNVEKFLRECLDSLIYQTMRELQIICIDDGSSDSSPAILEEYRALDPRIEVITKPNSGYGDSMNKGLELARGEYVGIVESDDFAELDMFERLYALAKEHDADVVKSNFLRHTKDRHPSRDVPVNNLRFCSLNVPFRPIDEPGVMRGSIAIWSGLYRKAHLDANGVRFLPTPGASFQDTSFSHKAISSAQRMVATDAAYLHYRVDNAASSVKSTRKVLYICEEYQETWSFVRSRPELWEALKTFIPLLQFDGYNWNLNRLDPEIRHEFYEKFVADFRQLDEAGLLDQSRFDEERWAKLQSIIGDPEGYFQETYGVKDEAVEAAAEAPAADAPAAEAPALPQDEEPLQEETPDPFRVIKESNLEDCPVSIVAPVTNLDAEGIAWVRSLVGEAKEGAQLILLAIDQADERLTSLKALAENDGRITLATLTEDEAARPFERGIELARGTYVAFVNQMDDLALARLATDLADEAKRAEAVLAGLRLSKPAAEEPETTELDAGTIIGVALKCPRDFARDALAFGPHKFVYQRSLFADGTLTVPQGLWMDDSLFLSTTKPVAPTQKPARTLIAAGKFAKGKIVWGAAQTACAARAIAGAVDFAIKNDVNELYTHLIRRVEGDCYPSFMEHAGSLEVRKELLFVQSTLDQSRMVSGKVPGMLKAIASLAKPVPKKKPDEAIVRGARKVAKSAPYKTAQKLARKLKS